MDFHLIEVLVGVLASVAAAPLMSVVRQWLASRAKYKISLGGTEIELRMDDLHRVEEQVDFLRRSPRVMIVHTAEHAPVARKIATDLQEHGVQVWLPEQSLRPGDSIRSVVSEAMNQAQWVVVIAPPEGRQSPAVRAELEMALAAEARRARPLVIPVKVSDSAVPTELTDRVYADFTKDYQAGFSALLAGVLRDRTHIPAG